MGIKKYKPVTSSIRFQTTSTFEEITKTEPEKRLTVPLRKTAGRSNTGRITVFHRGGGHKRRYRIIDFKRDKKDIPAKVIAIEYDPSRSARIALLQYKDSEKRYIIAPLGLKVGDEVISSDDAEIKIGNCLPIEKIPSGTFIHNIELNIGQGAKLCRSAGSYAQLLSKEGKYAHIKLPSGEIRLVNLKCRACIGQVGNIDHENITFGKAGRKRYLGIRPTTRGVAMDPASHPHGGGEGRTGAGHQPQTPWGKPTKGYKTRRNKRGAWMIIKDRRQP